ncbi:MAG: DUF4390 domain-containing protein [Gammaproteobacteria bacterium]
MHRLLIVFLFLPWPLPADDFGVYIEQAELVRKNGDYLLNAEIDYRLSPTAREALQNGIALVWAVRVKVWRQRGFLWNSKLVDLSKYFHIRYHALMNAYQVTYENEGERRVFSNLQAALDSIGSIRGLNVCDASEIQDESDYTIGLKIEFKREKLPLPLRPASYISSVWHLSSDWRTWTLQK